MFLDITSTALLETIFNLEEKSKQTQENSNITKPRIEESQSAIGPATKCTTQVNSEPANDPEPECTYLNTYCILVEIIYLFNKKYIVQKCIYPCLELKAVYLPLRLVLCCMYTKFFICIYPRAIFKPMQAK